MTERWPQHRDMSGYINSVLCWVYSAWDANRGRWRDLGTDCEQAKAAVAAWPDAEAR